MQLGLGDQLPAKRVHLELALCLGLVGERGARSIGLLGCRCRFVAAQLRGRDQRLRRGDLLGQTVDFRGGADGGEASGLVPFRSNALGRLRGLLMQLGQRREAGLDRRREGGEIGEARGRG